MEAAYSLEGQPVEADRLAGEIQRLPEVNLYDFWSPLSPNRRVAFHAKNRVSAIYDLPQQRRPAETAYYCLELAGLVSDIDSANHGFDRIDELRRQPGGQSTADKILDDFFIAHYVADELQKLDRFASALSYSEPERQALIALTAAYNERNTGCLRALWQMRASKKEALKVTRMLADRTEIILRMMIASSQDLVLPIPEHKS